MASVLSAGMPMPVSSTSKYNCQLPSDNAAASARNVTPPESVNLTALPNKLINTCLSLPMSSRTYWGSRDARSRENCKSLVSVRNLNMSSMSCSKRRSSNVSGSSSVRPASILDISSTSLIRLNRCLPLRVMMLRLSFCFWLVCGSRAMSSVKPRTAFSGVRNS